MQNKIISDNRKQNKTIINIIETYLPNTKTNKRKKQNSSKRKENLKQLNRTMSTTPKFAFAPIIAGTALASTSLKAGQFTEALEFATVGVVITLIIGLAHRKLKTLV